MDVNYIYLDGHDIYLDGHYIYLDGHYIYLDGHYIYLDGHYIYKVIASIRIFEICCQSKNSKIGNIIIDDNDCSNVAPLWENATIRQ